MKQNYLEQRDLAPLTLFKSHISFGERIISFERAKTNHGKLLYESNILVTQRQTTYLYNLFKLRFLQITSENLPPLTQKYSSYIHISKRALFSKRNSVIREDDYVLLFFLGSCHAT